MSDIVVVPHAALRQPAKPIKQVDQRLLDIISDLKTSLLAASDPQGVGLAAPQIGLSLRLFVIHPSPKSDVLVFINPDIINKSQRQQSPDAKDGVYEGCLSLPHFYSPLKRSQSVTVAYQTLPYTLSPHTDQDHPQGPLPHLVEKTDTFTGFTAHIIQHEVDHLNGVLFVDHVLTQNSKLYHIHGKTWEEVSL